ncbi:hypothetical protein EVAR_71561_1 [Eumeta japonica]|uniref:Uncharacterized protein n=1 Tax=Eumeta variegata TaxID=151549 RepID=A0A4C1SLN3_EUMVA|nr:hypothetical protein EVAR_71561_1 [Eumeta japonica]
MLVIFYHTAAYSQQTRISPPRGAHGLMILWYCLTKEHKRPPCEPTSQINRRCARTETKTNRRGSAAPRAGDAVRRRDSESGITYYLFYLRACAGARPRVPAFGKYREY